LLWGTVPVFLRKAPTTSTTNYGSAARRLHSDPPPRPRPSIEHLGDLPPMLEFSVEEGAAAMTGKWSQDAAIVSPWPTAYGEETGRFHWVQYVLYGYMDWPRCCTLRPFFSKHYARPRPTGCPTQQRMGAKLRLFPSQTAVITFESCPLEKPCAFRPPAVFLISSPTPAQSPGGRARAGLRARPGLCPWAGVWGRVCGLMC